jgi:hypothetical protein
MGAYLEADLGTDLKVDLRADLRVDVGADLAIKLKVSGSGSEIRSLLTCGIHGRLRFASL